MRQGIGHLRRYRRTSMNVQPYPFDRYLMGSIDGVPVDVKGFVVLFTWERMIGVHLVDALMRALGLALAALFHAVLGALVGADGSRSFGGGGHLRGVHGQPRGILPVIPYPRVRCVKSTSLLVLSNCCFKGGMGAGLGGGGGGGGGSWGGRIPRW